MPFHPDLRTAAYWLPRGLGRPWMAKLLRWLPVVPAPLPKGMAVRRHCIDGTSRVTVRIVSPTASPVARPAVLWIHGGGYVTGTAKQDDSLCARIAHRLQATVVSVDYRLAPEHPFPAPLEDCCSAFDFICREANQLGIDPTKIAIAGQSAGGGLAAALTHLIHDRGGQAPVCQLLVYPMLDDRTTLKATDDRMHRLWDSRSNRFGWASYLGNSPGGTGLPAYAVPARRSDLSGLPPAWIGIGTNDLFYDECVAYADLLRKAGVDVHVEIVDGAFHGFDKVVPRAPVSMRFFDSQMAALGRAFAHDGKAA